jgi:hypothetical protein
LHTRILKTLEYENPDVVFVDTQPGLDGDPEGSLTCASRTKGDAHIARTFAQAIAVILGRKRSSFEMSYSVWLRLLRQVAVVGGACARGCGCVTSVRVRWCLGVSKGKICGITNLPDAEAAVSSGADAIGFVFYDGSPRAISISSAAAISQRLPATIIRTVCS